jgi:hypothetical protein
MSWRDNEHKIWERRSSMITDEAETWLFYNRGIFKNTWKTLCESYAATRLLIYCDCWRCWEKCFLWFLQFHVRAGHWGSVVIIGTPSITSHQRSVASDPTSSAVPCRWYTAHRNCSAVILTADMLWFKNNIIIMAHCEFTLRQVLWL